MLLEPSDGSPRMHHLHFRSDFPFPSATAIAHAVRGMHVCNVINQNYDLMQQQSA